MSEIEREETSTEVVRQIDLDGHKLTRDEAGYAYLAEKFDFPEYFGKNLDALYDLLTVLGETEVTIADPEAADPMIMRVFNDAAEEMEELMLSAGEEA